MSGVSTLEPLVNALHEQGELVSAPDDLTVVVRGIASDSRKIEPGCLFCAVKGVTDDGHRFIAQAVERGASAAIVVDPVEAPVPLVTVKDSRVAAAIAAAEWFGRPAAGMNLYGVTGTNGKSTTASVIRDLLNDRKDVGLLGTLGITDGAGRSLPEAVSLTTPGPVELQAILRSLKDRNSAGLVMEVSSHALDQDRIAGLTYRAAAFTNLTHEHLDYHKSIDDYLAAKLKLIEYVESDGAIIYNLDTPAWRPVRKLCPGMRKLSYGMSSSADVSARNVAPGIDGTAFDLVMESERIAVQIPLVGEFNVSNVLCAAAVALAHGVGRDTIVSHLPLISQVTGRMERLRGGESLVLRDYAHTPDAMERVLRTVRRFTAKRLFVLFGCGGDRDRLKRPAMGRAAARNADVVFLTTDNPRSEDPEAIIADIASGIEMSGYIKELDRETAIERALAMLKPGDTLLLAGKGHENYQMIGADKLPFDEASIVRDYPGAA